jgi:hypothetical protein
MVRNECNPESFWADYHNLYWGRDMVTIINENCDIDVDRMHRRALLKL